MNLKIIATIMALICMGACRVSFAQATHTRAIYADLAAIPAKSVNTASGAWTSQNPKYNLSTILSLFFINEQTGWASGFSNRIYRTTDGAETWERFSGPAYSGYIPNWSTVFFVDELSGWAAGNQNIIHTADGGQTWVKQNNGVPESVVLSKIFFTDLLNGWAIGNAGKILHTTNGGETWSLQTSGTTGTLRDLFFISPLVGWVVGNTDEPAGIILKTTDGGNTWAPRSSSAALRWESVFFINSNVGWIGGFGAIVKTTDGGQTWNPVYSGSSHEYRYIRFLDEQNGWCTDTYNSKGHILKTSNGGASWTDKTPAFALNADNLFFINASTGWAANSDGLFMKTTDGGAAWKSLASATNSRLWAIQAMDNFNGRAAGAKDAMVQTTSGGSVWNLEFLPDEFPQVFYDVTFADSKNGWMCYSDYGSIYKTTDGGKSWTDARVMPYTIKALHDLVFLDALKGFAFGGNLVNRLIYKTVDGGNSWTVPNYPAGDLILDAFFLDENTGWAVCKGGKVLKTINGGDGWTEYNTQSDKWLESIFFIDRNRGFIVGESTILRTTNGGLGWESLGAFSGWIEDISFLDESHGIAVGGGFPGSGMMSKTIDSDGCLTISGGTAKIWVTSDGGNTWNEQVLGRGEWLLAAGFTDLNSGWAVGNNGTILRYSNTFGIPDQPTELGGMALSASEIKLSWTDNSDNENGFIVYRRDGLSGSFRPIDSLDANTVTYSDAEFTPGETYWYRVAAFNATGNSSQCADISVKGPAVGIPDAGRTEPTLSFAVYPNPIRSSVCLDFSLSRTEGVNISVFSLTGKLIEVLIDQRYNSGSHHISIPVGTLPSGVYLIRLEAGTVSQSMRCVKL